jgi:hypothetical protein
MNHMKQTIKHLHEIAAEASVQYNDLTGVIRLDGHSHFDYASMAESHKLNLSGKRPVGFGMSEHTLTGIGQHDTVTATIYYIDEARYGKGYDEIVATISGEPLEICSLRFQMKAADLGQWVKRIGFAAFESLVAEAPSIVFKD